MKNTWHKIRKIKYGDFALACSVLMMLVAMYCFGGETDCWKDFVICSFVFMLGAYADKARRLRDKISELEYQLAKQKRGRYDQIALNRLRERNG